MAINFDEFQSEESTSSSVNFDEFQPIEQKKPISQTITENIKKLAPSMLQEEALKSPFAKYQGPPQTPKPTDILIQPQADPLWEAQQTVKGILHGALTSPEAFTQQLPYAEGLGERGKPLVPPVLGEITKRIYQTAPVKKVLEPVTPEPGMAGQVGEIIGQLGMGAVLSMIPALAKAMRMKPTEVMQQVVAESKATNTPITEVVKNRIEALGTPTEAEVMAGQAIAPEMKPYSPALTGAYAKQAKIPEVKPTELAPPEQVYYHGTPTGKLDYGVETPGNQIPYGVHFTQDKAIAEDFASGVTKGKPTGEPGKVLEATIQAKKPFDVSTAGIYREGSEEFKILNEIGRRSRIKGFVRPYDAELGGFRATPTETTVNAINPGEVLDAAKPAVVKSVLKKYGYDEAIKYKMLGSTSPIGGGPPVYTDAIAVLNEDLAKVKPAEITPGEPKSFRVTPEEVKGEITPYREGMEEVKPPEVPPVEAKPTEPIPPTQPEISAGVKEAPTVEPTIPPLQPEAPSVMTEEQYLASKGAGFMGGAEPALHKNIPEGKVRKGYVSKVQQAMEENNLKRQTLREEYSAKVQAGEIRPPTYTEKLISKAQGESGNESVQAARRLLAKKGIDWEAPSVPKEPLTTNKFTPNKYGYQAREVTGLKEGYFIAQQSPERFDIIQSDVGTTKAIITKEGNKWQFQAEVPVVGKDFIKFKPTKKLFNTPEDAILEFNRYKDIIDQPELYPLETYKEYGNASTHRNAVVTAIQSNRPVPPEVLKDYPDLQKPSLAKRLITEEKGGLTIGGRREELLGKLGEPIEIPEKAVNINLKNLDTPDDVKRLITQIGKLYEPEIQEARRGVITHQQTAKLADDLGMSVEDLLKRKPGKAYSAEELLGARRLLTFAGEEAYTKAQMAAANPSNENMANALESMLNAIAVQKQVSGATAEAGRALQSAKILAGPEAVREQAMKRIIAQMGGQELTQEILARLGSLDISNPLAVNRFLRDISKARTSDKVYEVWLNALLSKPTTHMANDLSNLTTMLVRPFEELGAAIYEVPRAAFTGTPRERFFGEPIADIVGMTQGLKDAAKAFLQSVATEEPAFIKSTKIETLPRFIGGKAIKGPIGRGVRTPTTLLQAEDDFFKAWNYRGKLNALAYREAAKQGTGLKGMAEILNKVPEWMDEQARGEAVYRTFQQELGPQGKALMQFRNRVPGLRYIIPFLRTPTNILKFSLERTPLNLPRIATQALKGQIAGGVVSEEMGKIMAGSAIGYLATRYALEGKVTGGGPSSPGERKAWLMNHQPYSIKVGDHWIGYGRLEPIASVVGMSADLAELWEKMDTEDAVAKIGMAIARNFTSKTFMTGISDVVKAIEDPENAGEKWITRLAGTAVPAVVAGITQTIDPTIRRPENFVQGIEARLPFLSENIPPLRDIWGRPVIMQETGPERFVSPIRRMEIPDDKATSEYVRLGLSASTPAKSFGKIDITSDAYQTYLEQSGEAAHKAVSRIVSKPFYNRLNDMQRSELIKKVMENARKPYRARMKLETWRKFKAEGGTMKEFTAESRGYLPESLQTPGGE